MKSSRGTRAEARRLTHIILAGAPTQSTLLDQSCPLAEAPYLPAFRRFFKLDTLTAAGPGLVPVSSDDPVWRLQNGQGAWREVSLKRKHSSDQDIDTGIDVVQARGRTGTVAKSTGLTQTHASSSHNTAESSVDSGFTVDHARQDDDKAAEAQLLNDKSAATSFEQLQGSMHDEGEVESAEMYEDGYEDEDFLEHSFTFYQTAPLSSSPPYPATSSSPPQASLDENEITRSQLPPFPHEDSLNLTTNQTTSFTTSLHTSYNSSYDDDYSTQLDHPPSTLPPLPPLSSLTDLEDLPSPKEFEKLQSLHKRNPFYRPKPVSSIVGIISISEPIQCRNKSELVKLIVGDETASGFGVTIWLDSGSGSEKIRNQLCNALVRNRDVILLKNVVLNTFRGNVYLNSMRNGKTELEVLYRCGERDGEYRPNLKQSGVVKDQQVEKVRRVVDWVEDFVGSGNWGDTGTESGNMTVLPDDTQVVDSD